jgi:hypothetical protein
MAFLPRTRGVPVFGVAPLADIALPGGAQSTCPAV